MESKSLEYLASKTGKSVQELEEMWTKAKDLTLHEKIERESEGFNPVAIGTLARMLRLQQIELTEENINDFLIILEGGIVVDHLNSPREVKHVNIFNRDLNENRDSKLLYVEYVKRDKLGTFRNYTESFEYYEDGDPIFPVKRDCYEALVSRKVGQRWATYANDAIKSYVKEQKKDRFWLKCEETGNMYKYLVPKRAMGEV